MSIPEDIKPSINNTLSGFDKNIRLLSFQPISGGCINNGGKLTTSIGEYFLKWNDKHQLPGMFKAEANGLKLLSEKSSIQIPEVIGYGEGESLSWLLLEFIESTAKAREYWTTLGHQLAIQHCISADMFGLDHDNYIGALSQKNQRHHNWIEFLITQRFHPMLKMALEKENIDRQIAVDFEKLFKKLNSLLIEDKPALIHGDLWNGNVIVGHKGNPVIIDPAIYYGHREIEIAFTTLFGGFDPKFYDAYNEAFPLEDGFQDRFQIYNLYPLMVHVNLFGSSYLTQVKQILKKFV